MPEQTSTRQGQWQRVARRIRVPLGFAFAIVFLAFARPTAGSLLWSLLLVVPGLWLRAYAAGYVQKNAELTQTGPYAYTRNPLYLGSMVAASGFMAASRQWGLILLFAALFLAIYVPVIASEEAYLRAHFAGFEAYSVRVPRLFPRFRPTRAQQNHGTGDAAFSLAKYRRHREYNSVLGAVAIYAALTVLLLVRSHSHR